MTRTLVGIIVAAFLAIIGVPSPAKADWINLTGAQSAPNIAEIYVEDEDYLDMATALSGTGPSYVFLFMEAMIDAGVHLGFPRYIAEKLVLQTVSGAVAYVQQSPHHLSRLRNQVTSPGGTSAEAIYYLERAGFRTALSRAIWAAYQRSLTLGEGRKKKRLGEGEE